MFVRIFSESATRSVKPSRLCLASPFSCLGSVLKTVGGGELLRPLIHSTYCCPFTYPSSRRSLCTRSCWIPGSAQLLTPCVHCPCPRPHGRVQAKHIVCGCCLESPGHCLHPSSCPASNITPIRTHPPHSPNSPQHSTQTTLTVATQRQSVMCTSCGVVIGISQQIPV